MFVLSAMTGFGQFKTNNIFKTVSDAVEPETSNFFKFKGNPSCQDLDDSGDSRLAHIQTPREMKLDFQPPTTLTTYPYTNGSSPTGNRFVIGPQDPANSVNARRTNSSTFDWTSTKPVSAVIVKGGPDANVYFYQSGSLGQNGLQTPTGLAISHVTFCYLTPGSVTIIKEVTAIGGATASTQSFPFTSTNLGANNFSLVDNNVVGPDRLVRTAVYQFSTLVPSRNIAVVESVVPGWDLQDIVCTETAGSGLPNLLNTEIDFPNRAAEIRLEEGENVTCIFRNGQLTPSAAPAIISGRVMDANGVGVYGARFQLVNIATGQTYHARTNPFGYYLFAEIPTAEFYVLTISHKKMSFIENTRSFTLNDDLVGLDFIQAF